MAGAASNKSNIKSPTTSKRNRSTANKRYNCEHCEKSFQQKRNLQNHTRTHTGEKPYQCKSCPSKFSRKDVLVNHTRAHTGEKPFLCDYCPKSFAYSSHLNTHKKTHTGEKPFECKFCDYSAIRRDYVVQHERTHSGEKPFKCQLCSFKTTQKANLIRHKTVHVFRKQTKTKGRYECPHCLKVYLYKSSLYPHKTAHRGQKPHHCRFCDYSAVQKSMADSHEQRRHAAKIKTPAQRDVHTVAMITKEPVDGVQLHFSPNRGQQPLSESPPNLCKVCAFSASTDASVAIHMNALHKLPVVILRRLRVPSSQTF